MLQNKIKNSDLSDEDKANLNNILENGDQEFVEEYLKDVKMNTLSLNLPTEKICEMFLDNNGRVKPIAKHFNCSAKAIRHHLKKCGWEAVRHQIDIDDDAPIAFVGKGKSWCWYPSSGLALELCEKKVRQLSGLRVPESESISQTVENINKLLSTQEICDAYEQGKIVSEIAKKHHCTDASVRNHLKKGGYMFDYSTNVWTKGNEIAVKKQTGSLRNVINWMLEGFKTGTIQENELITVEMIANQFNISRDAASNVLSGAKSKGILGLKRIGKGVYQVNHQRIPVVNVQHAIPIVRESVVDSNLDNLVKVSNFAKEMGGLDKLINYCEILSKFKQ